MVITYYGAQYYKLQRGDIVIAINPVSKESQYKSSRFGSDTALVTLDHPDFNGIENLTYGDKEPFIIKGPGEYEIKKIFIKGYGIKTKYGEAEYINTIYTFQFDSLNVCFMGSLGDIKDLTSEVRGQIGKVDILFIPVGGDDMISTSESYALASKLEPSIIIPMQCGNEKGLIKKFTEESGGKVESPVDKLTIKAKDLEDISNKVVVFKSNS